MIEADTKAKLIALKKKFENGEVPLAEYLAALHAIPGVLPK